MELLEGTVVPRAFHNSGTASDAPKCAPNTRRKVLEDLQNWLDDDSADAPHTLWIRGAAGAGKTAIARTFAIACADAGRLSGSFFFLRARAAEGHRDEQGLVATLAYQLAMAVPGTEQDVLVATRNRFLFTLTLRDQIERLILTPLRRQAEAMGTRGAPSLFIIDGLDEVGSAEAQVLIVQDFVAAMASTKHDLPHKLLVLSRARQNIMQAMVESWDLGVASIELDDDPEAEKDIHTYLVDGFSRIRRIHPLREDLPDNWPAREEVLELAHRSSGQFIYAATVLKYIKSDRGDPVERLQTIISREQDATYMPFKDLDDLYAEIFAQIENLDRILLIFRVILMEYIAPVVNLTTGVSSRIAFIHGLLGISRTAVMLALKDMPSILQVTATDVHILHGPVVDFLLDDTRSGIFYVNSEAICLALVQRCLDGILELNRTMFEDELTWTDPTVQTINRYLEGVCHFQESITDGRPALYDKLCEWDIKDALHGVSLSKARSYTEFKFCLLMEWIVAEHRTISSSNGPYALQVTIVHFQSWWMTQAQKFSFKSESISTILDKHRTSDHVNRLFRQHEVLLWLYLTTHTKDSELHRFFWDSRFFGRARMDGRKCAVLAYYCFHYLLCNSPDRMQQHNLVEDIMLRARRVLNFAERRRDLALFFEEALGLAPDAQAMELKDLAGVVEKTLRARFLEIEYLHWCKSLSLAISEYLVEV